MKIGLAWLTVAELAPPEQVSVAAQAGYTHVGLRLIPVANQVLPSFDMNELERRLAGSGVQVLDVEVFRLEPDTRIAGFEPTLEVAQRLGATEILVHGADPDEARLAESFSRLCELASRYGLHANLEPMPWVDVSTVAKAMRILKGNKHAALLVDAIHFFRADNSLEDLQVLEKNIFRYMQLCDAHPGRPTDAQELVRQARGDRLFPGEGALDLPGLMRALPPGVPVSVEIPYARPMSALERASRALAATKALLGR